MSSNDVYGVYEPPSQWSRYSYAIDDAGGGLFHVYDETDRYLVSLNSLAEAERYVSRYHRCLDEGEVSQDVSYQLSNSALNADMAFFQRVLSRHGFKISLVSLPPADQQKWIKMLRDVYHAIDPAHPHTVSNEII